MIRGFVILMTAEKGSVKEFLISRVVRLYPAFWVCCTITFLATLVVGERLSSHLHLIAFSPARTPFS
jgi:peptidoglycan/LPS O-acetylase OafA/YrhL